MSCAITVRKVLLTQPDDPRYVPIPAVPITSHQKAWQRGVDEGVIHWNGIFPSRLNSCAVPRNCKPQKPHFTQKFGESLRHGDVLKFSKKFNGWSCVVCVGRDENGRAMAVATGRFNHETPFTYCVPWEDCFREWTVDVFPEFWAELVAYGPRGEQLGYEAVSSVMAYLKKTPNPPADAPYLCIVLFAFRFAEWDQTPDSEFATQFSGDMLESLQAEEQLLNAFVSKSSRTIQVVEGTYFTVDKSDDGSIRLMDLSDNSIQYNSWDGFIQTMDRMAIGNVWEGYVLSRQRTIFDCPDGGRAWKEDRYKMCRDHFSLKRRPGIEPELCLLCIRYRCSDGRGIYALYGQEAGNLLQCGFLDIKVCSEDIRSILVRLVVFNGASYEIEVKNEKEFPIELEKPKAKFVNDMLDCGYLIWCVPTWITWKRHKLSGIKFVNRGLLVEECEDFSEMISNVGKIAASLPYMNEVHRNTAAVLNLITELNRPGSQATCGGGAVVVKAVEDGSLPPPLPPSGVTFEVTVVGKEADELIHQCAQRIKIAIQTTSPMSIRSVAAVPIIRSFETLKRSAVCAAPPPLCPFVSDADAAYILSCVMGGSRFDLYKDLEIVLSKVETGVLKSEHIEKICSALVRKYNPPDYESHLVLSVRKSIADHHSKGFDKAIEFFRPISSKYAVKNLVEYLERLERFLIRDAWVAFETYTNAEFGTIVTFLNAPQLDTVADLTCAFSRVHTRRYSQSQFEKLAAIFASKYIPDDETRGQKRRKVGDD